MEKSQRDRRWLDSYKSELDDYYSNVCEKDGKKTTFVENQILNDERKF